jgi:hypothetical protein
MKKYKTAPPIVSMRLWDDTRRNGRLLAALLDVQLAEVIDMAVTSALTAHQQKQGLPISNWKATSDGGK